MARREGEEASGEVALLAVVLLAQGNGVGRDQAGEEGQQAGFGGVESRHAGRSRHCKGLLDRWAILIGLKGGALRVVSVSARRGSWLLGGEAESRDAPLGLQLVQVADQRLEHDDPLLAAEAAALEQPALDREGQREGAVDPHTAGAAIEEEPAPPDCPRLPEAHSHHGGAQPRPGDRVVGLAHVDEEQPAGDAQLGEACREVEVEAHIVTDVPLPQEG